MLSWEAGREGNMGKGACTYHFNFCELKTVFKICILLKNMCSSRMENKSNIWNNYRFTYENSIF